MTRWSSSISGASTLGQDGYFLALVAREGVEVFDSAVTLIRQARARGLRTAVASSSRNCSAILRAARATVAV